MRAKKLARPALVLAASLLLTAGAVARPAVGQELPPPDVKAKPRPPRPKPQEKTEKPAGSAQAQPPQAAAPVLLLSPDFACALAVDGDTVATLKAQELRRVNVTPGPAPAELHQRRREDEVAEDGRRQARPAGGRGQDERGRALLRRGLRQGGGRRLARPVRPQGGGRVRLVGRGPLVGLPRPRPLDRAAHDARVPEAAGRGHEAALPGQPLAPQDRRRLHARRGCGRQVRGPHDEGHHRGPEGQLLDGQPERHVLAGARARAGHRLPRGRDRGAQGVAVVHGRAARRAAGGAGAAGRPARLSLRREELPGHAERARRRRQERRRGQDGLQERRPAGVGGRPERRLRLGAQAGAARRGRAQRPRAASTARASSRTGR